MEDVKKIAEEMANKYKENELKWILVLQRLKAQGYSIEKDNKECKL